MAFIRTLLRYVGLIMILAIYVASGIQKITAPSPAAMLLSKSNFPRMIAALNVNLSPQQYIYLIQLTGIIFVSFSFFILLGVGRSFFSFLLAVGTIIMTLAFHVNLDDPMATDPEQQVHMMKNIAITGAFLFVAGSGHRSRKYYQTRAANDAGKKKN